MFRVVQGKDAQELEWEMNAVVRERKPKAVRLVGFMTKGQHGTYVVILWLEE